MELIEITGSEWSSTDLFQNLKDVMPGDTLTETIKIKNADARHEYTKIYLRAIPHDEEKNPMQDTVTAAGEDLSSMIDFLEQLTLTVMSDGRIISVSKASELGNLSNEVLLGIFEKGAETTLTVSLSVPATMGNDYMRRAGEIDWILTAEEYTKEETIEVGDTGIFTANKSLATEIWPAALAMILMTFIGAMILFARKKRRK